MSTNNTPRDPRERNDGPPLWSTALAGIGGMLVVGFLIYAFYIGDMKSLETPWIVGGVLGCPGERRATRPSGLRGATAKACKAPHLSQFSASPGPRGKNAALGPGYERGFGGGCFGPRKLCVPSYRGTEVEGYGG